MGTASLQPIHVQSGEHGAGKRYRVSNDPPTEECFGEFPGMWIIPESFFLRNPSLSFFLSAPKKRFNGELGRHIGNKVLRLRAMNENSVHTFAITHEIAQRCARADRCGFWSRSHFVHICELHASLFGRSVGHSHSFENTAKYSNTFRCQILVRRIYAVRIFSFQRVVHPNPDLEEPRMRDVSEFKFSFFERNADGR